MTCSLRVLRIITCDNALARKLRVCDSKYQSAHFSCPPHCRKYTHTAHTRDTPFPSSPCPSPRTARPLHPAPHGSLSQMCPRDASWQCWMAAVDRSFVQCATVLTAPALSRPQMTAQSVFGTLQHSCAKGFLRTTGPHDLPLNLSLLQTAATTPPGCPRLRPVQRPQTHSQS